MYKLHTYCRACGLGKPAIPTLKESTASGPQQGPNKLLKVMDIGLMPLANDFCSDNQERKGYAPLTLMWCPQCTLAQLSVVVNPSILYSNYPYVTSHSKMMMDHFDALSRDLKGECGQDVVVEIGSNDGTLLDHLGRNGFKKTLGIEPSENLVDMALKKGIATWPQFFTEECAWDIIADFKHVDLVIARHVFCHIDDWHSAIQGLKRLCGKSTTIAIEVPYLLDTVKNCEWDQCLPPGELIVSDRGLVPIEKVKLGDRVLTHNGRFKKVTTVFENQYDGEVINVMAYGQNTPLVLTPEHPVYAMRDDWVQWIAAKDLKVGDRILRNKLRDLCRLKVKELEISHPNGNNRVGKYTFHVDHDLCRLVGFYLAEGFYYECKKGCAQASFAFGKSESEKGLAEECCRCLRNHNAKASMKWTKYGWRVTTYGGIARLLYRECGTGALNKHIPSWAIHLNKELVYSIVDAYARGDGYLYRNDAYWRISTVSILLAQGMALLANQLGYPCSINVGNPLGIKRIANNPRDSVLVNPPIDILIRKKQTKKMKVWCDGCTQYSLIRSVSRSAYIGTVHNLEVEEDSSYQTAHGDVHNCYHEHLSYLTLKSMRAALQGSGLHLHKVIHYPIHGGAILMLIRKDDCGVACDPGVFTALDTEKLTFDDMAKFAGKAECQVIELRSFVTNLLNDGKTVVGYGASAKSAQWIAACGFTRKQIKWICDETTTKQWKCSPGSDIPIVDPGALTRELPDYAIMFCWNYKTECVAKEKIFHQKGGRWIVPHGIIEVI